MRKLYQPSFRILPNYSLALALGTSVAILISCQQAHEPAAVPSSLSTDSVAAGEAVANDVAEVGMNVEAGDSDSPDLPATALQLDSNRKFELPRGFGHFPKREMIHPKAFKDATCKDVEGKYTEVQVKRVGGMRGMHWKRHKGVFDKGVMAEIITRQWSKTDKAVGCKENRADVSWSDDVSGLKLVETFKRGLIQDPSATVEQIQAELDKSTDRKADGTSTVNWQQAAKDEKSIIRTKLITFEFNRSFKHKDANDKEVTVQGSSKTEVPLKVEVEREKANLDHVLTRTIVEGKVTSEHNGTTVSKEFSKLLFEPGSECRLPASGTVKGTMTKADKTTSTYELVFVDHVGTMTVDGNKDTARTIACHEDKDDVKEDAK